MPWKLMKSYRISPRKWLSAFSTAENRLCRTLVRRRDDFRRFCIFFISPRFWSAEKRRPKKRIKEWFGLLFGMRAKKADEILSDFSTGMIIRFFYRRKSPLPYNCTATWQFSTLLHLFYLSPIRVGWKAQTEKADKWMIRAFVRHES